MINKLIIQKTVKYVREKLEGEGTGHDWWHIWRVWQMSKHINQTEKADGFIVELGALLHDIADWKFTGGDESVGPRVAREWLESLRVSEDVILQVCHIIQYISYKGAGEQNKMESLEGKIVQDADRLDALGAIGIARCFAYGGSKGRELYNPDKKFEQHKNFEEYKNSNGPSLNHFYEKLLLVKDLMNTKSGKKLAIKRHQFLEEYLKHFYSEWDGKL